MSRENGFYRVYCRTDQRWKFREFCDGEWHEWHLSEREFNIAYDVPEQESVNPVPAVESYTHCIGLLKSDRSRKVSWFNIADGLSSRDSASEYANERTLRMALAAHNKHNGTDLKIAEIHFVTTEIRVIEEAER